MLCRFLAEPAFIVMRPQIMYVKRKHYTYHNKYYRQGFLRAGFYDALFICLSIHLNWIEGNITIAINYIHKIVLEALG